MNAKQLDMRKFAENLYIHENKEVAEIVDILGLPQSTIYSWFQKGNWEDSRSNHKLSASKIASMIDESIYLIFKQAKDEQKGILTGAQGDTIGKLHRVKTDMLKESNYMGIAFDVIQRLQNYLRTHAPKLLPDKLIDKMGEFLKHLIEVI